MSKNSMIIVACPDQGEGTGPEALGHQQVLRYEHHQDPTFIDAYCRGYKPDDTEVEV